LMGRSRGKSSFHPSARGATSMAGIWKKWQTPARNNNFESNAEVIIGFYFF
jgi:hypothetical protein